MAQTGSGARSPAPISFGDDEPTSDALVVLAWAWTRRGRADRDLRFAVVVNDVFEPVAMVVEDGVHSLAAGHVIDRKAIIHPDQVVTAVA